MVALLLLLLACSPDSADDSGGTDLGPSSGTLRTLTYNVHGLPSVITGDDTPARMAQIAPLLAGYDLVGLQEDFDEANHQVLTGQAPQPVQEWFDETLDDSRLYGSGLALLGPGVATLVHEQHYALCNGVTDGASDCLASKGFQVVRLDLGQAEVDVYNTHMEAGSGEEDDAARASHVAELLVAFEEVSADRPVIFMGDTNLHGDEAQDQALVEQLLAAGLREACDEVACPEPGRIDRIMVRDGGRTTLEVHGWSVEAAFFDAEGVPLSDHDAIFAEIGWAVGG